MSDNDALEFDADFAADLEEASAQEDVTAVESGPDFSDDGELTLEVDDEDFELDEDVEALEAAGVDSTAADRVVEETETAQELAETLDGAGPNEETPEEKVAVDEGVVSTAAAPVVRIEIERGAEAREVRDAVLGVDIEDIDFEFEDE